jgi:ATP-dependent Lhr-like helicase
MIDGDASAGMDAFSRLSDPVRAALSERGFMTPTEPQRRALPTLTRGRDALVIAPTGSGKTETAMFPVFSAISEREQTHGFQALYVTPLRALNRDMRERLEWWGEKLEIEVDVRHGDTSDYRRSKQSTDPPDVLVTTPETLQAMFTGEKLRRALADVEHVVVDEVHELAAAKRGAQLAIGLEHLKEYAGPFQRIGLSATVGDPGEVGKFLTAGGPCEVIEVDVGSDVDVRVVEPEVTAEDERAAGQLLTDASVASHVRKIDELVRSHESVLVFVNTRQTAEGLGSRLKELGTDIGIHHGSLSKTARIDVEDRFKSGELPALMCTSSMELGIDVGTIDHVVQYQSPREVARLLQRVGRAGHRRDETSSGTIITTRPDDTFEACVVAAMAERGEVEPADMHTGSLDTVANQICGLLMGFGEIDARRAYEIVTRAYPFRHVTEEQFREVIRELSSNRCLWLEEDDDRIKMSRGTWQYFYSNLSMIPDEANYEVRDVASSRTVGTLAERFVVNFAMPGEVFIQGGEMWRINNVDQEEEQVNVAPVENPSGEVPSWVGQEIPVPHAVAQGVGRLRGAAMAQFSRCESVGEVARWLASEYPTDGHTAASALAQLERHDAPVPDADTIVVEFYGREVVVNACLGHKTNETLGRLYSALVGQQTGASVAMEVDPYRIELELPRGASGNDVTRLLRETDPDHVRGLIELSLKNADALKFKLAQVATKFGALKDTNKPGPRRFGKNRLLEALRDTPIYDEAVREVLHEDLDVDRAGDVLRRVQSGELDLVRHNERTAIGLDGRSSGQELLSPENADQSVIDTVRERLHEDRVLLACLHCKEWDRTQQVKRVADQPECPKCGSTQIAALNPWADEVVAAVRASQKDEEQEKMTERAYRAASLVQSHGKQAVLALAARGVGPHNAAQIINKLREDEDLFYRDILTKERQYARTKSFW